MPAFCHALKYGWKATIDGDGKIQRDYVYVLDVVNELINIGESSIKGQTDIGYGIPVSTKELYSILCKTFKKKQNVSYGPPRKGDIKYKCSKYKIEEPKYGFKEGARRTVLWALQEKGF